MTIVCAARHFVAAHESCKDERHLDFAEPCTGCEYLATCKGDWMETAAPLFEAADIHPQLCL